MNDGKRSYELQVTQAIHQSMPSLEQSASQDTYNVEESDDYKYFLAHTMNHTVERLKPLEE